MRSFGLVENKLEEADFFLQQLTIANFATISYYFSAFVSSTRTVTFAMQSALKGVSGFQEWYSAQQVLLRKNSLARFFHDSRTDSQHLGLCPIRMGLGNKGESLFFFGETEPGRPKNIPSEDVLTCCYKHMKTVCILINDCIGAFGLVIDPNQIYTISGLKEKGWTIEDVEETIGLPRGYTDISLDLEDKEYHRLRLLRRHISMSFIGNTLAKHIGHKNVISWPLEY